MTTRRRLYKESWTVQQAIIRSHLDDNDSPYSDDLAIDDTVPSAMEWTTPNAPSSDNATPATASVDVASESTTTDTVDTANDNECPICFETRRHCSLRPCGHSICTTCVARLLVCAMCRAPITSPDPHVDRDTNSLRHAARRFQEESDMHELREAAVHIVPAPSYSGA